MPLTQLYRPIGRLPEVRQTIAFHQLTVAIDLVLSKGRVKPEEEQIFGIQSVIGRRGACIHGASAQNCCVNPPT